jgi:hypothetical protein
MTERSARVLPFVRREVRSEPVSPFRHLMPDRPLTRREVLHRQRMIAAFAGAYRFTRVRTASEYGVKSFPGSASSNRSTNESGPVIT